MKNLCFFCPAPERSVNNAVVLDWRSPQVIRDVTRIEVTEWLVVKGEVRDVRHAFHSVNPSGVVAML